MTKARALGLVLIGSLVGCLGAIEPTDPSDDGASQPPPPEPASDPLALLAIGYPPSALTNDADYVYWSELNAVYRAAKINPVREKLYGDGTSPTMAIAVDDAHVYSVDYHRGTLIAWAKDSRSLEMILPEGSGATSLTDDANNLYLTSRAGLLVIAKANRRRTLLREGKEVLRVAVSGSAIYTLERAGDAWNVVRSSSAPESEGVVVTRVESPPLVLVAAEGEAYWIAAGRLMSSRSDVPIYASPPGRFMASGLTVLDGEAFVTENPETGPGEGSLVRISLRSAAGSSAVVERIALAAPNGAPAQTYGHLQTRDRENVYLTALRPGPSPTEGSSIVKVPLTR